MKAVIFTIDAIFSMIIAGVAITMLLYFSYTPQTPFLASSSDTRAILNTLSATTVAQIAPANYAARQIVNQYNSKGSSWMQYAGNTGNSSSPSGPQSQSISFIYNLPYPGSLQPVAGYGNIYLASGNEIIAVNASSGVRAWEISTPSDIGSIALYNNMLIYWNYSLSAVVFSYSFYSSYVVALSAKTGAPLWSNKTESVPISPILIYGKYGVFGTSSNSMDFYNLDNGSLANGYILSNNPSFNSIYLSVLNGGPIMSRTSYNGLAMSGLSVSGRSAGMQILYQQPPVLTPATTNLVTSQGLVAYGSGAEECASYSNTIQAFCFSPGMGTVYSVSSSGSMFLYQTSNSIIAIPASGSASSIVWTMPFNFIASPNSPPVLSQTNVYSAWANGVIAAQNISTGTVLWLTQSPYGSINSMILAYGRLYAVSGKELIAYGGCQGTAKSSVLAAAANLYANGNAACADSLLNSVYQISNYTMTLNGTIQGGEKLPYFNGANSYVIDNITNLPLEPQLTMTAWVDPSKQQPSGCVSECGVVSFGNRKCPGLGRMLGLNNQDPTNGIMYVSMSAWCQDFVPSPGPEVKDNQWNFIAMVMNGASVTLYANGQSMSGNLITIPGAVTSENLSIGMQGYPGSAFPANTLNGSIADVQIYSYPLASNQISELYHEGLSGGPLKNQGLSSWWPLDGNANDYGPNNNTGYPSNIIYRYSGYLPSSYVNAFSTSKASVLQGLSSYVADFNGETSYVETNSIGFPNGNSGRSAFAWVYFKGTPEGCSSSSPDYAVFDFGTSGTDEYSGLMLCGSQPYFAGGGGNNAQSSLSLLPNSWNLVGYTYTKGTSSVTIYLNGAFQILPLSAPLSTLLSGSYIGSTGNGPNSNYFNGNITDVQVYNTTLSLSAEADLFDEGITGFPLNGYRLVGWWPLNGNIHGYGLSNQTTGNDINYSYVPNLYNIGIVSWR